MLILVTVFWGVTFPLIKESMNFTTPVIFLAIRFMVSAAFLLPLVLKHGGLRKRGNIVAGFFSGLLLFMGYFFQTVGLVFTSAADSGIITGLYVVLIPFFSVVYLRMKVSGYDVAFSFLSLSGLIVMSAFALNELNIQIGNILTVICAVAFALQIAYVSRYSPRTDIWPFTFYTLLFVSIFSFAAIPLYPGEFIAFNYYLVFTLVFTAILAGSFAMYAQNMALRFIDPGFAGIIFVAEPVFAAISSVIIGNEVLSVFTVAGGSLMVLSMALSSFYRYRKGEMAPAILSEVD